MNKFLILSAMAISAVSVVACSGRETAASSAPFPVTQYSAWTENDDVYRFYPGDRMTVTFATAPELDRELVVAPDGRIVMPLVGAFMAADRSTTELRKMLEAAYFSQLVDPTLTVAPLDFESQQIFVAGEVENPGVYPLPGQIDPLQAVTMAGGWTYEGKPQKVVILRRARSGEMLRAIVDIKNGVADPSLYDIGPLKRFDVVFVTRSRIADENQFIRQFVLDALPLDFSFYYNLGPDRRN